MKNWYKNQKGSMAVYVTITILCFIFILTGLFLGSASIRKGQLRTIVEIVDAYQKDNDKVEEIYANREILDTSKYVQNGLVLFYDGINNTGSGHSNKVTSWKDLTENGYDLNLNNFSWNTTSGWTDNALHFDGINDYGEIKNLQSKLSGPITITVCFNSEEARNYRGLFGNHIGESNDSVKGILAQYGNIQGENVLVLGYNTNIVKLDWNKTINKNMSLTVQMDPSIGTKVYVNGELIAQTHNDSNQIRPLEPFWVGKSFDGSNRYFLGKMNNFMLYNRLLTDEEIRANYKLDIQRYGVENIPTTVQEAIERNYVFNENRTILDEYENRITIPAGFKILPNGGTTKVEYTYSNDSKHIPTVQDGIVIQDNEGNEFVWVPVGNIKNKDNTTTTMTLGRYTFSDGTQEELGKEKLVQSADNYTLHDETTMIEGKYQELESSETNNQTYANSKAKNLGEFIAKTKEKGGYYIARYEAVKGEDGKVKSMPSTVESATVDGQEIKPGMLWSNINQIESSELSQGMYGLNDNFETDLVNSYAWETAIVFIQKYSKDNSQYSKQSTKNNGGIGKTGEREADTTDKVCNIYDMASNSFEWSTETSIRDNYPCVIRGGTSDSNRYTSYRSDYRTDYPHKFGHTFRTILYVKL